MKNVSIIFAVLFFSFFSLSSANAEEKGVIEKVLELVELTQESRDASYLKQALKVCRAEENKIGSAIKNGKEIRENIEKRTKKDPSDPIGDMLPDLNKAIRGLKKGLPVVQDLCIMVEDALNEFPSAE